MGRTAMEILKARPMVRWYMVDPWQAPDQGSEYAQTPDTIAKQAQPYFDECYAKTLKAIKPWAEQAEIIRGYSEDAVGMFGDGALDSVFIDAEHSYDGVKRDTLLWLPKVRDGGFISWHDVGNLPRYPGVEQAIDEVIGMDNVELDGDCTAFYYVRAGA